MRISFVPCVRGMHTRHGRDDGEGSLACLFAHDELQTWPSELIRARRVCSLTASFLSQMEWFVRPCCLAGRTHLFEIVPAHGANRLALEPGLEARLRVEGVRAGQLGDERTQAKRVETHTALGGVRRVRPASPPLRRHFERLQRRLSSSHAGGVLRRFFALLLRELLRDQTITLCFARTQHACKVVRAATTERCTAGVAAVAAAAACCS